MQYRNLAKLWLHEAAANQLAAIQNHYRSLGIEDIDDFDWVAGTNDKPLTGGQRKKLVAAIEKELEASKEKLRNKQIIED